MTELAEEIEQLETKPPSLPPQATRGYLTSQIGWVCPRLPQLVLPTVAYNACSFSPGSGPRNGFRA